MMTGSMERLFTPVPELNPDPSQPMSLIFLANRAIYTDIVADPWFNATGRLISSQNGNGTTYYASRLPGSVLACLEQFQIW